MSMSKGIRYPGSINISVVSRYIVLALSNCVKACGRTLTPIRNPASTRDARTLWTFVSCACLRTQPRIRDGICTDGCCFPSANAGEQPFELRKFVANLKAYESARDG